MNAPGPAPEAVRAHYAELARAYDARANRACNTAYRHLARETLAGRRRVLEVGAGSGHLLASLEARVRIAADLSPHMLRAGAHRNRVARAAAEAARLPFPPATFDGALSVNMLEHVADPRAVVAEAARVLQPGAPLLLVTPNGGVAWLLETLERLRLKLPEGPHRFLDAPALRALATPHFDVTTLRAFLALPAGPGAFVRAVDRLAMGHGLFLYAVFRRRTHQQAPAASPSEGSSDT